MSVTPVSVAPIAVGRARVGFTTRVGGHSSGPFASLNLGDHVGDDPACVAANRAALAAGLGLQDQTWHWMHQVHGDRVALVGSAANGIGDDPREESPVVADAALTTRAGHVVAVLSADCAPIALIGEHSLAVVHAGWRGLLAGVVTRTIAALRAHDPGPITAILGPCLHSARYEFVGPELDELAARFGPQVRAVTEWDTPALDLPAAVCSALRADGVAEADIVDLDICTASSEEHFSYRRDGVTGRQALIGWLES